MSSSSIRLNSVDRQRAGPSGRPVAPVPHPEPRYPALADLAALSWLAATGSCWVLRRSAKLVLYPLSLTAREIYERLQYGDRPLSTDPAGSSPRHEDGTAAVVDLAAYRLPGRMARAARLAQNAQPAGRSRPG